MLPAPHHSESHYSQCRVSLLLGIFPPVQVLGNLLLTSWWSGPSRHGQRPGSDSSSKCCLTPLSLVLTTVWREAMITHALFTDEKTEVQRSSVTYPRGEKKGSRGLGSAHCHTQLLSDQACAEVGCLPLTGAGTQASPSGKQGTRPPSRMSCSPEDPWKYTTSREEEHRANARASSTFIKAQRRGQVAAQGTGPGCHPSQDVLKMGK